jgi:hypothetical protein
MSLLRRDTTSVQKFKTFKYDAAPFFFIIDVFPSDPELTHETSKSLVNKIRQNPVIPLPMRVDRVFNGEISLLIRPREIVSFPVKDDTVASINPVPFLQLGIEKLLYFTEIRSMEAFIKSIIPPNAQNRVNRWWNITRNRYAPLYRLEEDFNAFLRAYLLTVVKAKLNEEDLVNAAKNYSQMVHDICDKRMTLNSIRTDMKGEIKDAKMYKVKEISFYKKRKKVNETQYHPELIDLEIFDLSERGFLKGDDRNSLFMEFKKTQKIKYIALLFYDDLMECMLQNLEQIENGATEILDPSFLIEKNAITLTNAPKEGSIPKKTKDDDSGWWSDFGEIDIKSPIQEIEKTNKESLEFQLEISKTTELMDKQSFSKANQKLTEILEKVKNMGHFNFCFNIENLIKACNLNLEYLEKENKFQKMFENGKIQEAQEGLVKLLKEMADPDVKDYVDVHVEIKIERTLRLIKAAANDI